MITVGSTATLPILKLVSGGAYLDGGKLGEIYVPRRELPAHCRPGDQLTVFIYRDNETTLTGTTATPAVQVGQCGFFKVVTATKAGVFMDWGLPKDLFIPASEQYKPLEPGRSYVVLVYIDERTGRLAGTAKLHSWLNEDGSAFAPGQAVELLVCGFSELGYKVVVNHTHLGLIFRDDVPGELRYGQQVQGYVKAIRPDKKLDVSLLPPGKAGIETLCAAILSALQEHSGSLDLTDKSPAEEIGMTFGVSKSAYKKALGHLYKNKTIRIEPTRIVLLKM